MLATPAKRLPPDQERWAFEFKWDGVRAIVYVESNGVSVQGRSRRDVTTNYPELAALRDALDAHAPVVLDGEIVALGPDGTPSFQALQPRMHNAAPSGRLLAAAPAIYMVFDVLEVGGRSVLDQPYRERRPLLEGLGPAGGHWQVPPSTAAEGDAVLAATRHRGLEGVVAKRLDSLYEPGRRSRNWLKVKNKRSQELVVGGWAEGQGRREGSFGALLVGYYEGDDLVYAGHVGSGFTDRMLDDLGERLRELERTRPAFKDRPPPRMRRLHWVEPGLVAEVEFTEWTNEGTLRHPVFKGLRDDKPAREVVRE